VLFSFVLDVIFQVSEVRCPNSRSWLVLVFVVVVFLFFFGGECCHDIGLSILVCDISVYYILADLVISLSWLIKLKHT
jgi:hypothetical protein